MSSTASDVFTVRDWIIGIYLASKYGKFLYFTVLLFSPPCLSSMSLEFKIATFSLTQLPKEPFNIFKRIQSIFFHHSVESESSTWNVDMYILFSLVKLFTKKIQNQPKYETMGILSSCPTYDSGFFSGSDRGLGRKGFDMPLSGDHSLSLTLLHNPGSN